MFCSGAHLPRIETNINVAGILDVTDSLYERLREQILLSSRISVVTSIDLDTVEVSILMESTVVQLTSLGRMVSEPVKSMQLNNIRVESATGNWPGSCSMSVLVLYVPSVFNPAIIAHTASDSGP